MPSLQERLTSVVQAIALDVKAVAASLASKAPIETPTFQEQVSVEGSSAGLTLSSADSQWTTIYFKSGGDNTFDFGANEETFEMGRYPSTGGAQNAMGIERDTGRVYFGGTVSGGAAVNGNEFMRRDQVVPLVANSVAALRRRNMPDVLTADQFSPLTVTETVTAGTSTTIASGTGIAFMPSGKAAALGGNTVAANGAQSNSYMFNWKYPPNGGSPSSYPNPSGWAVEFMVMGTRQIEFLVYAQNTGAAWNLIVDGRKVYDVPRTAAITGASQSTIKFDLGDSNPHRIRFEMQNLSLRTIFGQPTGTAWFVAPRGPRVFFLGDSTVQGASQSTGGELGSWIYRFGRLCGFEDIWNGAIGSTGFIANNSGASATYVQRATTDVVPSKADIVIIGGYYNDRSSTAANIAVALESTVVAIRAVPVPPIIIVIGSYDPTGSNGSPYTAIDAALISKCTALGVPYICPVTGGVYDGDGNTVIATGAPWITNANKAAFIGADNVHQTDAGQKYMAYRTYEALRALLPA